MWLLIDDCRDLGCEVIARNAKAACKILKHCWQMFNCVCFDHDLGAGGSGYEVLVYAITEDLLPNRVQLVTSNPPGRAQMTTALNNAGFTSTDGVNFYRDKGE